jgi:hypothetical protein
MNTHYIYMNTPERLSRLDLKIHEVSHQECLTINETSHHTEKIISYKYNSYLKFKTE